MARWRRRILLVPPLTLLLLALPACGGDPADLWDQEATQVTVQIEMGDGWFDGADLQSGGLAGTPAELTIPSHTDVTFELINLDDVPHSFGVYASERYEFALVTVENVGPGETHTIAHHFHDAQTFYMRDMSYPGEMTARLHIATR